MPRVKSSSQKSYRNQLFRPEWEKESWAAGWPGRGVTPSPSPSPGRRWQWRSTCMARLVTLILLYNGVAGTSLSIDSNLTSTAELVGHVVGTLKDLTCNKMLSVMNIFLHRALKISSKLHQTHFIGHLQEIQPPPPLCC